jgi:cytochrome c oxidase subunit 2
MRSQAVVDTQEKFDAWLAALGKPAAPAGGGGGAGGAAPAEDGKAIFTGDSNCGTCHTLADAGTTGSIGPNLDTALKGKDAAFIKQSVVDPSAEVAKGYQDGIMPPDFGQTLTPAEIDALVKYLSEVTKGG